MDKEVKRIRSLLEAKELLTDGVRESKETKKLVYDKTTGQFSLKIPKSLALKANLDENSEFVMVFNPMKETMENLKTMLVLYKKEEDEKGTN